MLGLADTASEGNQTQTINRCFTRCDDRWREPSMSKFDPYSRRALRAMFWAWAARNRRLLVTMTAVILALLVLQTAILTLWWQSPAKWYLLGLVHAALIGAFAFTIGSTFLAHNTAAIWHLRGAWGEDATRNELKRAKRKRVIWGSVDSVNLQIGDIDHFVVTRRGGLIVIDSKWRTETVTDPTEMARAAAKVKLRAEALARTVLQSERGAHRAAENPVVVLPAVVLWGPAQHALPDDAQSAGIQFVGGRRLVAWLDALDGQPIDKHAAADLLRQLKDRRASAWDRSAAARA